MVLNVDSVIGSVRHLHSLEVEPLVRSVDVSKDPQGLLFGVVDDKAMHVKIGDFYEFVSIAFYGGARNNRYYVPNGDSKALSLVKPDIVDSGRRSLREVKANKWTQELNLLDAQMGRYISYMGSNPHLIPTFEVYRHRFVGKSGEGSKSFRGTEEELFGYLSKSTAYSLRLPISLVLAIWGFHKSKISHPYVRRYEAKGVSDDEKFRGGKNVYPSCTCVRNKTLVELLSDPEAVIRLVGKNPKEYTVRRFISPLDFKIGEDIVPQFPILDIVENQLF